MHPFHSPRQRSQLSALAVCILLASCGSGEGEGGGPVAATPAPVTPAATAKPAFPTTSINATLVLPAGVTMAPNTLTVFTSAGEATPAASGAVTLNAFSGGTQLAVVMTRAGNPLLMGWVDASHQTISVATTAQVLAYFALGGSYMPRRDRESMIAGLPQAPGLATVEAVIASALAANPEAFAQPSLAVQQALKGFAAPFIARATTSPAAADRVHAQAVAVLEDKQSGIAVLEDPPLGAHLTNSFRRRAHAFVERVSHRTNKEDVPDPVKVMDFEVPPTTGLTGGVTGAISDIFEANFGNKPTAYVDVSAPDDGIKLQLVEGSDRTTYKVTVVGPGLFAGVEGALTAAQKDMQLQIATLGMVQDFLVPLLGNGVLGSGLVGLDSTVSDPTQRAFLNDMVTAMASDLTTLLASSDSLGKKIGEGKWGEALGELSSSVISPSSNTLGEMFKGAITHAVDLMPSQFDAREKAENFVHFDRMFHAFDKYMDVAGGVLQVFDAIAYLHDFSSSHRADQWTVIASPSKALLNPLVTVLDVGGTVDLTAGIAGVEDMSGYSFRWTTTQKVGYLMELSGAMRVHVADYCSSSNRAQFLREPGIGIVGNDTVTVKIYSGSGCNPSDGYLGGVTARVYAPRVTITPNTAKLKNGESATLTATLEGMRPLTAGETLGFKWTTTRAAGELLGSPDGGIGVPVDGPSATYRAHVSNVGVDTVTAAAVLGGSTRITSDQAKMSVGGNFVVVTGRVFEEHWKDENCHTAMYAAFPKVEGAKSYDVFVSGMRGYFGESWHWYVNVSASGVAVAPGTDRGNEILIGLGGGGGGGADCISAPDDRFAPWYAGSKVEVTAKL